MSVRKRETQRNRAPSASSSSATSTPPSSPSKATQAATSEAAPRNYALGGAAGGLGVFLGCFTNSANIGEDSRWIALALSIILAALIAFSPILAQLGPLWQAGRKAMKKKKTPISGLVLLVLAVTIGFGLIGPSGIITVGSFIVCLKCLFGKTVTELPAALAMAPAVSTSAGAAASKGPAAPAATTARAAASAVKAR